MKKNIKFKFFSILFFLLVLNGCISVTPQQALNADYGLPISKQEFINIIRNSNAEGFYDPYSAIIECEEPVKGIGMGGQYC